MRFKVAKTRSFKYEYLTMVGFIKVWKSFEFVFGIYVWMSDYIIFLIADL